MKQIRAAAVRTFGSGCGAFYPLGICFQYKDCPRGDNKWKTAGERSKTTELMTKEVFELVKSMDMRAVETQIALRCAPVLAGLNPSNLLVVGKGQLRTACMLFTATRFTCFLLEQDMYKAVLLLYEEHGLESFLKQAQVKELLMQKGYPCALESILQVNELLRVFAGRYRAYLRGDGEFPHEMGLFLGYPVEDVRGFMENEGKNFIYAGYWKVYENAEEKRRLFQKFDRAREALIRLVVDGGGDWIRSNFIQKSIDDYVRVIV